MFWPEMKPAWAAAEEGAAVGEFFGAAEAFGGDAGGGFGAGGFDGDSLEFGDALHHEDLAAGVDAFGEQVVDGDVVGGDGGADGFAEGCECGAGGGGEAEMGAGALTMAEVMLTMRPKRRCCMPGSTARIMRAGPDHVGFGRRRRGRRGPIRRVCRVGGPSLLVTRMSGSGAGLAGWPAGPRGCGGRRRRWLAGGFRGGG